MMQMHRRLVKSLMKTLPESTLIETHISSVILSGDRVYKLKKPVDFGFLNFSTLQKRKIYCEEEVRINGRFAPQLEYRVARVTGSAEAPELDGEGEAIEYAVVMRRFEQAMQLDRVAARGRVDAGLCDRMAEQVAVLHEGAVRAEPASDFGTSSRVLHPVAENFSMLEQSLFYETVWEKIEKLKAWSFAKQRELESFFEKRKEAGMIRECHGDLHLRNIALVDGVVTPFDAIEFNPYFRWIDVISDLAFLLMDLEYTGQKALANRLLNRYLDLALGYTETPRPFLALMQGLSGSGKSRAALFAAGLSGGVRVRSDIERMRLFGGGVYTPEATKATYEKLGAIASEITEAGFGIFVDATFLKAWQRGIFMALAKAKDVSFYILECRCDEAVALERIAKRLETQSDVSEADREVYALQKRGQEPFSEEEKPYIVVIDCNDEASMRRDVKRGLGSRPLF